MRALVILLLHIFLLRLLRLRLLRHLRLSASSEKDLPQLLLPSVAAPVRRGMRIVHVFCNSQNSVSNIASTTLSHGRTHHSVVHPSKVQERKARSRRAHTLPHRSHSQGRQCSGLCAVSPYTVTSQHRSPQACARRTVVCQLLALVRHAHVVTHASQPPPPPRPSSPIRLAATRHSHVAVSHMSECPPLCKVPPLTRRCCRGRT